MRRFTEVMVRVGCRARCRKAGAPTVILPSSAMQTALGVLRLPFSSASRMGKPLSTTPTSEFVVPRSMPRMGEVSGFKFQAGREVT
jgi:hypothetical protein